MSRRNSILNFDEWLDNFSDREPDSIIYDQDYLYHHASTRLKEVFTELEDNYKETADLCAQMGLPQDAIDERLIEFNEYLRDCLSNWRKSLREDFEKMCQYKLDLLQKVEKMTKDLYLPPYVSEDNITLLQHCKRLKTDFNRLNQVREKRVTRWKELKDKQLILCTVLGSEPPEEIKTHTDIPTEEELDNFATIMTELEREEKRRKEKFRILSETIIKCLGLLEREDDVLIEQLKKPDCSEASLKKLTDIHSDLEAQYAANRLKFDELRQRLESLYDRLDITGPERDVFLKTHSVCKPSLIGEMEIKIEEYELLKKQNISKFIEKIHQELSVEYERCFVSQEQQDAFLALATEPSEELLSMYEKELERMKKFYNDNRDILERFEKWRNMWKELIELEIKANDPNRFNNRGGQLLTEEKKRKGLQRNLPKVEKDLVSLNGKYLAQTGHKFKVFGTNLDEFITGCWDELHQAKEVEKRERAKAKMTPSKGPASKAGLAGCRMTPIKRTIANRGSRMLGAASSNEHETDAMHANRPTSAKRPASRLCKK